MIFRKKRKSPAAPNFIASYPFASPKSELETGAFLLFLFVSVFLLFPFQQFAILGVLLLLLLVVAAIVIKIEWGIYALGFFSFFHGWEIALSKYNTVRGIPGLSSLNAPLVDFIALVLLVCVPLAMLLKLLRKNTSWQHLFWPTIWYILFVVVAFVSAKTTNVIDPGASIKYLFRPIIFVYLSYLLLPHIFIQKKIVLERFLRVWFWVGCIVALFGLSSLILAPQSGWLRVQPYGLGSFAPLGYNHNLIAEVLVAIIPVGMWLMWKTKSTERSKQEKDGVIKEKFSVYFFGTGLMTLVALGTLSRAAWITLFFQGLFVALLFKEQFFVLVKKMKKFLLPIGMLAAVFVLYMGTFLTSHIVSSSNSSRVEVAKIVAFYAMRSPLLGYGPGSFIPIIQETYVHTVEFGEALDAHGFVQKVLLEEGFLGAAFFGMFLLTVLFILFRTQLRTGNELHKLLFVTVLGAMIFQVFNTSYFNSVMWMPIGVALTAVGIIKPFKKGD